MRSNGPKIPSKLETLNSLEITRPGKQGNLLHLRSYAKYHLRKYWEAHSTFLSQSCTLSPFTVGITTPTQAAGSCSPTQLTVQPHSTTASTGDVRIIFQQPKLRLGELFTTQHNQIDITKLKRCQVFDLHELLHRYLVCYIFKKLDKSKWTIHQSYLCNPVLGIY